jgi:hypothetical protein
MEDRKLARDVISGHGIGIYVFISDHIQRAAYTLRRKASHHSPYYVKAADGTLVREGNFQTARPFLYWLYRDILSRSNLMNLLQVNLPTVGDDDIHQVCLLIDLARHRFMNQFSKSEFYVLFHPSDYGSHDRYTDRLHDCLKRHGIPYMDYSDADWYEDFNIPGDAHPNADGHHYLADIIAPDLRQAVEQLNAGNL